MAVGMSGGNLGDGQSPLAFSVASSSDGIRWAAARPLDSRGLDPSIQVAGLVQGPTGLLLVGRPAGNTCGGPPTVAALWSSRDGLTWRRVAWPRVFGSNRVQTLDAGSAGDIATGLRTDGRTPAIWLSTDGVAWRSAPLPQISAGRLVVTGATSFAGGLVVAGAVIGPEGCGGASSIHPSIWWSADGASWTREPLTGASNGNDAAMSIVRITDRALVAIERSASPGDRAWLSDDGRTWTRIAAPSTIVEFRLVTDGRHAVAVVRLEGASAPAVIAFHETGSTSTLAETGDRPDPSADGSQWSFAVGPTGILMVRENGGTVWLGHPRN
ncbi:MAG TPA: hypothetical protein VHS36_02470 [Candidatus Limnocylindrales bacterium]|nr:hypothetical protein [Candidatus Limnocylindrales bacterium]